MEYIIRKRQKKDCAGISKVITVSWNETYKGIVPDEELKRLKDTEDERTQKTIEEFNEKDNDKLVLMVNQQIVGFSNYGFTKEIDDPTCGEIFALYIIKEHQGKGLGRKLVNETIKELKKLGCDKMIISCLKGNHTNDFYKHIGGVHIKDGVYKRLNLPENIYFFDKI